MYNRTTFDLNGSQVRQANLRTSWRYGMSSSASCSSFGTVPGDAATLMRMKGATSQMTIKVHPSAQCIAQVGQY